MVIEYIRYRVPAEQAAHFREAYGRAAESLRASAVCHGYELTVCHEEPTSFVLRILWTSVDEHLNVFRKSSEFQAFFREIREFLPNIEEMRHYTETELRWTRES